MDTNIIYDRVLFMPYIKRGMLSTMNGLQITRLARHPYRDSNHHSSTPAAWFASGTVYHGRRYQNLGSWTSLRSYTIVDLCPKQLYWQYIG